ncbi:MAG: MmcQ/YjbR family DNA-binding protein [Acidobacteriota bacterium]
MKKPAPVTFETVRELALALPEMEEGTSYGTPAFKIRGKIGGKGKGKMIARLREDGESLVVKIDMLKRDILMHAEPETFYITEHYQNYPYILVRISTVRREVLRDLLEQAWRLEAPKQLIKTFDDKI